MRRLLSFVVALVLCWQAGTALAHAHDGCCDGCPDVTMCMAGVCQACQAPAIPLDVAAGRLSAPAFISSGTVASPLPEIAFEIWRPPWRNGTPLHLASNR